jgi:ABC-type transport system involved in multi-copper enzyme maturation permease subunit
MTFASLLHALRWLIQDTLRYSCASKVFWLMLGLSGLCIVFCLGISVEGDQTLYHGEEGAAFLPGADPDTDRAKQPGSGVDVVSGQLCLAFGAFHVPLPRDRATTVQFLQAVLGGWVGGTLGLLLALVWTAGFIPSFLEPTTATVLLAKPIPRWCILLGKYLGVLAFVGFHTTVFVGGTWLALGLRTGVWNANYLWCIPLLLAQFLVMYSFSVLIAVWTRSTVACIFASVLFWLLCYGMNFGRHTIVAMPWLDPSASHSGQEFEALVETGYWLLPKPTDMNMVLDQALKTSKHFSRVPQLQIVQREGAFFPAWSIVTSLLFAVVLLVLASRQLREIDY